MDSYDAVVVGASVAGLLAAQVLAERLPAVALVERDTLPGGPLPRRGQPQAEHVHVLLARGRQVMDHLVPGFGADLVAQGAPVIDSSSDLAVWGRCGRGRSFPLGVELVCATRSLLDWSLRRRVLAHPRLHLLDGAAAGLLGDRDRVDGVRVRAGDAERSVRAALVVDATGRASRTPAWLRALGHPAPPELVVDPRQGYASRLYRPAPGWHADWRGLYVPPLPPDRRRGATLLPVEGGRWLVGLSGRGEDQPPADEQGYLGFARGLAAPEVAEALARAEPLTPVRTSRATGNRWVRYDRVRRRPAGLAVVGDAACAFNPVYGQGMTVAALDALALGEALDAASGPDAPALADAVARAVARTARVPWLLATGQDGGFPDTVGAGPRRGERLFTGYVERLSRLSLTDPVARAAQLEVFHLLRGPGTLLRPRLLVRAALPARAA